MEDLNRKISDCVKSRINRDITPADLLAMSFEEQREYLKQYSECYLEEIKKTSRDEFDSWLNDEMKVSGKKLELDGKWLLSYYAGVGLPSETLAQLVQLGIALETAESMRELMWNPDVAPKLLGLTFIQLIKQLGLRLKFQPYFDLQTFSRNYLGLDSNWIVSVIVLAIEELLVRKKLDELSIEIGDRESFPKLCDKLVKSLESSGVRPSCEVLKSKGRREIRNRVLHEGDSPTEDEAFRLMGDVLKLAKDLWPGQEYHQEKQ